MQTTLFKVSCCFCQVDLKELTQFYHLETIFQYLQAKNTLGDGMKNQVVCI